MRGLGYFLLGSGNALLVAGWISIARKGEANFTASTIGLILVLSGALVLVRQWERGKRR